MKHFLNSHGVREEYRPGALSVRCFILLMDLNKEHLIFEEMDGSIQPEVKTEAGFHSDIFGVLIGQLYPRSDRWGEPTNQNQYEN